MFLGLITPLGAVPLVLIAAALVTFPALALYPRSRVSVYGGMACALAVSVLGAYEPELDRSIQPESTKALVSLYRPPALTKTMPPRIEFSEWNSISRIDVTGSVVHPRERRIFIDGDAWTSMFVKVKEPLRPWNPDTECLITWASPYLLIPAPERVLVIGAGGGVDVLNALRASAGHVDAVEINPTTARIVKEEYKSETKSLFGRANVAVYNEEGRSFARSGGRMYDVIIMNAIDTFAALNSGAYVLSESYLYTVDAMKDYITHLKPGGILNISRWKTPAESVRLFTVMIEAMYELGYETPERHLIAVFHPFNGFIGMMASNEPFTDEQVQLVRAHAERNKLEMMFPLREEDNAYSQQRLFKKYVELRRAGRQDELMLTLDFDPRPVWDDSPFFFNFLSVRKLWSARYASGTVQILRGAAHRSRCSRSCSG